MRKPLENKHETHATCEKHGKNRGLPPAPLGGGRVLRRVARGLPRLRNPQLRTDLLA